MADLFYGVIALKNSDVIAAIDQLKAQNLKEIADWLNANEAGFYGKRNEDWKPFNGQTIGELINETKGYQSQTNLLDLLKNDASNISIIRPIRVFFIDVFALFLQKYVRMAQRVDYALAENGQCCLLIPNGLSPAMQDQLLLTYCGVWSAVCNSYRQGSLHRIAMRVDDLQNFRNYLLKLFGADDTPSMVAEQELSKRFQYETKTPPSFARV